MYVRRMEVEDLPAMMVIQAEAYFDVMQECVSSFCEKLHASPQTCFVCCDEDGRVTGYVITVPIKRFYPPRLNDPVCEVPVDADCLYLHDMAVGSLFRGKGVGALLVEAVRKVFYDLEFEYISLIAVQEAHTYWAFYGFEEVGLNECSYLRERLRSYGYPGARYMEFGAE